MIPREDLQVYQVDSRKKEEEEDEETRGEDKRGKGVGKDCREVWFREIGRKEEKGGKGNVRKRRMHK